MSSFSVNKKEFSNGKTQCNVDFIYGENNHYESHTYVFDGELSDEWLTSALENVLKHYDEEAKIAGI